MSEHSEESLCSASTGKQVARASGVVGLLTLVSRVLGLVRDQVTAYYFGAGMVSDAFFVAFKVPNLLRRLVAEGSLAAAFVPVLTDELAVSKSAARKAIGAVTSFSILLTATLTILGMVYAEGITAIFAPGWAMVDEKTALSVSLMRLMFPYIVIVSVIALCTSALNALGRFAVPSSWPAILNITIIISLVLFSPYFDEPIYALAVAVLAGGLIALLPQLYLLRKLDFEVRLASPLGSRAVRKLVYLMIPSVFSASVYQIMIFINTSLASMLEQGSVSWLYYADRLFQFPLGVFAIAVATAVLPALSRAATAKDKEGFDQQLDRTLGWVTFITIPASVGLMALSEPIIRTFFDYGHFSQTGYSAPRTALALFAYSIGLWAVSCQVILVRCFLAKKNTVIPAAISCVAVVLNIMLAFMFMGRPIMPAETWLASGIVYLETVLGWLSLGHVGLALAGSLASYFSLFLLTSMLSRIDCDLKLEVFLVSTLRALSSSVLMWCGLWWLLSLELPCFVALLLGLPLGVLLYFCFSLLFNGPEVRQVLVVLRGRLNKGNRA